MSLRARFRSWVGSRALGFANRFLGGTYRAGHEPAYRGAGYNRLTADWVFSPVASADQEASAEASILRARARELVRNNSWARRYITIAGDNVGGERGIKLQARLMSGKELNERMNDQIEAAWRAWCRHGVCTVDRKWSFVDVQRQIVEVGEQDGEILIRMVDMADNPFGFAVQLLDIDQLDETYCVPPSPGQNEIRYGVEIDGNGAPVAYHIFQRHPSEGHRGDRVRVTAADIIHYYSPYRIGQTRGVTSFAPVMWDLNMLRGYQEAELVAARTAAANDGYFIRKGDPIAGGPVDEDYDPNNPLVHDAEPGVRRELPLGLEFQSASTDHPTTAFSDFVKSALRSVASGLSVSYAALNSDLSDANYSSMREGKNVERDRFAAIQQRLIEHVIERIYRRWVDMAVLHRQFDGRIRPDELLHVEWQGRRWPYVDPDKESKANVRDVQAGLNSRTAILAARGRDIVDVIRERSREEQLANDMGVDLTMNDGRNDPVEPAEPDAHTPHLQLEAATR